VDIVVIMTVVVMVIAILIAILIAMVIMMATKIPKASKSVKHYFHHPLASILI
jgi:hypothetical protein